MAGQHWEVGTPLQTVHGTCGAATSAALHGTHTSRHQHLCLHTCETARQPSMLAALSAAAHSGATMEGLVAKVTLPRGGLAGLAGGGDLSGRASAVAVAAAG